MFEQTAKANLEETKAIVKQELAAKLKDASPLAQYEVDEIIENISINSPTATKETISIAVEAVLNLESSKNGQELLMKLFLFLSISFFMFLKILKLLFCF